MTQESAEDLKLCLYSHVGKLFFNQEPIEVPPVLGMCKKNILRQLLRSKVQLTSVIKNIRKIVSARTENVGILKVSTVRVQTILTITEPSVSSKLY